MDTADDTKPALQGGRDDQHAWKNDAEKNRRVEAPRKRNQEIWVPLVLEKPTIEKKLMLEISSDSRMVVDWVNGHAKLKSPGGTIATVQNLLWEWWSRGVDLRTRATKRSCACVRGRRPVSVGAFFFLLSSFLLNEQVCLKVTLDLVQ